MSYFVVKEHSHTDKQFLLKVLSRNMVNLNDAVDWADTTKSVDMDTAKTNRRRKEIEKQDYFVVQRVEENVELKVQPLLFRGWKVRFDYHNISVVCELVDSHINPQKVYAGEGRSMNEAFDDAMLKFLEENLPIPDGWVKLERNRYLKPDDRKWSISCHGWIKALENGLSTSLWTIDYMGEKTLFIRKKAA